ncbi:MAG: hypothetical protein LBQ54_10700 [Planctomycetaceae bacterium]|nr:hypothetical protein [Planctomycetaceae bacterium]
MKQSGVSFGTSGIRGLSDSLTDRLCYSYVTAFLQYIKELRVSADGDSDAAKERQVAVSGDFRPTTSRIIRVIVRAAQDHGYIPVDCGRFPTPALALYAMEQRIPAVMVTGSHIAENRNGMKFFLPDGEILKKDEEALCCRKIEISEDLFDENGNLRREFYPRTCETDHGAAAQTYYMRYLETFPENCLAGYRIGFLMHSSVSGDILGDLYESLGAEVARFGRVEKFVAVDTESLSTEFLEFVKQWGRAGRFDVIFSADGDGDRPLIFDENGDLIPGDLSGIVTSLFLNADTVVTPVTSNTVLERINRFPKILRTKVGSPYVIAGMEQAALEGGKVIAGYEANGGFLTWTPVPLTENFRMLGFRTPAKKTGLAPLPTRDPAIVHLALLLTSRRLNKPFSAFHTLFPPRVTQNGRLSDYPVSVARAKLQQLQTEENGNYPAASVLFGQFGELTGIDFTDGVRMTFDANHIIHLRVSGNSPEFRCYIETENAVHARRLLHETLAVMDSWRSGSGESFSCNPQHPMKVH